MLGSSGSTSMITSGGSNVSAAVSGTTKTLLHFRQRALRPEAVAGSSIRDPQGQW
jgi:hypothetical protein